MIAVDQTAVALLCAGLSQRHPAGCKLMRELHGSPLVAHSAETLQSLPFRAHLAVVPPYSANPDLHRLLLDAGFDLVTNTRREDGQDSSIRIAARVAAACEAAALVIALGDMPFIKANHLLGLLRAAEADRPSASGGGERPGPPCVFPAAFFPDLITGGRTPRQLIRTAGTRFAIAPAADLADFDTAEDFEFSEAGKLP